MAKEKKRKLRLSFIISMILGFLLLIAGIVSWIILDNILWLLMSGGGVLLMMLTLVITTSIILSE